MGAFHQVAEKMEHLARGQIDGGISPGGINIGASYARGQIDGCRKIRAPYQGADRWGYFTRGRKDWSTLPGARWLGQLAHEG